jgi:probable lipoprotein NlpC
MHWTSEYVGLPWQERGLTRAGIACWGLAHLVYAEQLGITVPDYAADIASTKDRDKVAAAFADGTGAGPWVGVAPNAIRDFDILVFRIGGIEAHVGISAGRGRMLHASRGVGSCLAYTTRTPWSQRLAGAYRHQEMVDREEIRNVAKLLVNLAGPEGQSHVG